MPPDPPKIAAHSQHVPTQTFKPPGRPLSTVVQKEVALARSKDHVIRLSSYFPQRPLLFPITRTFRLAFQRVPRNPIQRDESTVPFSGSVPSPAAVGPSTQRRTQRLHLKGLKDAQRKRLCGVPVRRVRRQEAHLKRTIPCSINVAEEQRPTETPKLPLYILEILHIASAQTTRRNI